MAAQCLPCEKKRVSQQSHKIRQTIIDPENLFPQTDSHKAEDQEQAGAVGVCTGSSGGAPQGTVLMEQ